ncbi:hypothetical protein Tsubulata_044390, partial [Turnera subulata]
MIKLSPTMPAMNTAEFIWTRTWRQEHAEKFIWTYQKQRAWRFSRKLLARGQDLFGMAGATTATVSDICCICKHYSSCTQFQELALGLELTTRPFILVVRPETSSWSPDDAFFKEFQDRVGSRGKIVSWSPQQKVLVHPSIACFVTHCGWNSTVEGVGNGIPFLCWPCFGDQFFNQSYVCDAWKTGLRFNKDENGMITRWEIKDKVELLLSNGEFKSRAGDLQGRVMDCVKEGGSSHQNLMKKFATNPCLNQEENNNYSDRIIYLAASSICLAKHGVKITFAITENNHEQLVKNVTALKGGIHLVSISDGLESSYGTKRPGLVPLEAVPRVLQAKLRSLFNKLIHQRVSDKISCILSDLSRGRESDELHFVQQQLQGVLIGLSITKLIEDGIIDEDGTPTKGQMIKLSPTMPAMNTDNFSWTRGANKSRQKTLLGLGHHRSKLVDWQLCNSSYELEPGVFTSAPHIIPIGPLYIGEEQTWGPSGKLMARGHNLFAMAGATTA